MDIPLEKVVSAVQVVGFPIAVAAWLLWRQDKRLEKLTETINKLVTVVTVLTRTLDLPEADEVRLDHLLEGKKGDE